MRNIVKKIIPKYIVSFCKIGKLMAYDYGFIKSLYKKIPVDKNGDYIPWYTYPAIEFLIQFDLENKKVFEYGSGGSSIFFSKLVDKVVSVEDNKEWSEKVSKSKPSNLELLLKENKEDYVNAINTIPHKFDIIVIDGKHRDECSKKVKDKLNDGGFIILDNSDWYPDTTSFLRNELDLIQVDFNGFGPLNNYTWSTSFFLKRNFNFKTKNNIQPQKIMGK